MSLYLLNKSHLLANHLAVLPTMGNLVSHPSRRLLTEGRAAGQGTCPGRERADTSVTLFWERRWPHFIMPQCPGETRGWSTSSLLLQVSPTLCWAEWGSLHFLNFTASLMQVNPALAAEGGGASPLMCSVRKMWKRSAHTLSGPHFGPHNRKQQGIFPSLLWQSTSGYSVSAVFQSKVIWHWRSRRYHPMADLTYLGRWMREDNLAVHWNHQQLETPHSRRGPGFPSNCMDWKRTKAQC